MFNQSFTNVIYSISFSLLYFIFDQKTYKYHYNIVFCIGLRSLQNDTLPYFAKKFIERDQNRLASPLQGES